MTVACSQTDDAVAQAFSRRQDPVNALAEQAAPLALACRDMAAGSCATTATPWPCGCWRRASRAPVLRGARARVHRALHAAARAKYARFDAERRYALPGVRVAAPRRASAARCALVHPGDEVLLFGTVGDHGIAILLARGDLDIEADVRSDTPLPHIC